MDAATAWITEERNRSRKKLSGRSESDWSKVCLNSENSHVNCQNRKKLMREPRHQKMVQTSRGRIIFFVIHSTKFSAAIVNPTRGTRRQKDPAYFSVLGEPNVGKVICEYGMQFAESVCSVFRHQLHLGD